MNAIQVAFREMSSHRLRTVLTLLGVAIAIATVVTVGALLSGAARVIQNALYDETGTSRITIRFAEVRAEGGRSVRSRRQNPLSAEDAHYLAEVLGPDVELVTAHARLTGTMVRRAYAGSVNITAVQPPFLGFARRNLLEGRNLTSADYADAAAVAVVGAYAAKHVFHDGSPLGEELRLNGTRFVVVGVVEDVDLFGTAMEITTPLSTCIARLSGCANASITITARVRPGAPLPAVRDRVLSALMRRHRTYEASDFSVRTADSVLKNQRQMLLFVGAIFAIICGICLLLGGVGVMNVLLSSVAERTREVGVRRAVGARRRDIFRQFIIEALALSMAGCAVGTIMGYALSMAIGFAINLVAEGRGMSLRFHATPSVVVLAIAIATSMMVGVIFGAYPARLAARRDPAEALRTE